jgi:hypothetical protein
VNHLDKVDRKQAEKQKEERRKEKRPRAKELEAKRSAFEAAMVADRQLLEERHLANDAVTKAALMEYGIAWAVHSSAAVAGGG